MSLLIGVSLLLGHPRFVDLGGLAFHKPQVGLLHSWKCLISAAPAKVLSNFTTVVSFERRLVSSEVAKG